MAFDAVASFGIFRRAAGALCVSVGAISKHLAALETFVGKPLFEKKAEASSSLLSVASIGTRFLRVCARLSRRHSMRAASGSGVLILASV